MREAVIVYFYDKKPLVVVGEMSRVELGRHLENSYAIRDAFYNKNGIVRVPENHACKRADEVREQR